jgi:Zn-dependent peptidase ImmA (M78 family)
MVTTLMKARELPPLHGLTYGAMRSKAADLDVHIESSILPDGYCGIYDDAANTILIHRDMKYTLKRCTLVHELVHWAHRDGGCYGIMQRRAEYRTRRETAVRLISPAEYAIAEQIYEGDVFRMANELDVTKQVIEDYQNLVLSK